MGFFRHASRSLSVHLSNKKSPGPLGVVTHQLSPSYVRHSSNVFVRSLSTTPTTTRTASFAKQQPSPAAITSEAKEALNASSSPRILDEQTLLSQLSPLKRILCLCPVPLGQKRLSWSGGDSCIGSDENPAQSQTTPVKIHKYRYGEQYEIGVAVSDPYLTHAVPVKLVGGDGRFVAEMVPTFRGDAHNLGSSSVFHTNLPYFRNDLLHLIGHFDIGAVVIALPMKLTTNPSRPISTNVQMEQELKLVNMRDCILNVLQNYVTTQEDEEDELENDSGPFGDSRSVNQTVDNYRNSNNSQNAMPKRRTRPLGPLNLQGYIQHRLSIDDVLSKSNDCDRGSWDHIAQSLGHTQNQHSMGNSTWSSQSKKQAGNANTNSCIPSDIHASVALTAMMEQYTSGYHNSFF